MTLVAYDSFPTEDSPLNTALDEFTASTGIKVTVVTAGDAGTMLTKARADRRQPRRRRDVGRRQHAAVRAPSTARCSSPYEPNDWNASPPTLTALVPGHEVTPVDFGDVCINYDKGGSPRMTSAARQSLTTSTDPRYKDLLVVEDPAASSPGLAFLLATIAKFGSDGWQSYWKALRANGVKVSTAGTPRTTTSSAAPPARPAPPARRELRVAARRPKSSSPTRHAPMRRPR